MVPTLGYYEKRNFQHNINKKNSFCVGRGIPPLPPGLLNVSYRVITPVYQADPPLNNPISKYHDKLQVHQEKLRLMLLEVEVIDIIANDHIPKMSKEERL